jgi:iron complex transport system permease protein
MPLVGGLLALVAALVVATLLSVSVGANPVPFPAVWEALTAYDPTDNDHLVIWSGRMPRTVLGVLAGAALAVAGAVMQGLTRNPLGDPGVLGVNAGAALVIVLSIQLLGVTAPAGQVWFGLAGAAIAMAAVYRIGSSRGSSATPTRMALAGAGINAVALSATTALLMLNTDTFARFRFWQVGSLEWRDWTTVFQVAPLIVAGLVVTVTSGRGLNAMALGDDVALGQGVHVVRTRIVAIAGVAILCGAATAAVGPIAFVGLAVPHIVQAFTGADHRWTLPYSMVLGAVVLLLADVAGRWVVRPAEVQVGIVTAVLGAPVFIALVRRRRVRG